MKMFTNSMLAKANMVCRTWISPKTMPAEEMTAVGATLEMGQAVWTMSGEIVPKTKTDNREAQGLLAVWPGTFHGVSGDDDLVVCYKGEAKKYVHPRKTVLCKTVDSMVALASEVVPDSDVPPPSDHSAAERSQTSSSYESEARRGSSGAMATPKKKKQRKDRKRRKENDSGSSSDDDLAKQPNNRTNKREMLQGLEVGVSCAPRCAFLDPATALPEFLHLAESHEVHWPGEYPRSLLLFQDANKMYGDRDSQLLSFSLPCARSPHQL